MLFIILDDVGIDQLSGFNAHHPDPPLTPTLDALAAQGLKFTRFTTMPECSPTRAAFFTGRYPLRTGGTAAIFEADLPRAHVSSLDDVGVDQLAGFNLSLLTVTPQTPNIDAIAGAGVKSRASTRCPSAPRPASRSSRAVIPSGRESRPPCCPRICRARSSLRTR